MNIGTAALTRRTSRLLVRKGTETLAVKVEEIAIIYKAGNCVFVITSGNQKWIADRNLSLIMTELDPKQFFRANRQFIINIEYLQSFRPYHRVKLLVKMSQPEFNHSIVISQEQSAYFKKWVAGDYSFAAGG